MSHLPSYSSAPEPEPWYGRAGVIVAAVAAAVLVVIALAAWDAARGIVTGVVVAVVAGLVYFLPSLLARSNRAPDLGIVVAINVLVGWTFVGWVVAFVMALRKPKVPAAVYVVPSLAVTAPQPGWYPQVDGSRRYWTGSEWV